MVTVRGKLEKVEDTFFVPVGSDFGQDGEGVTGGFAPGDLASPGAGDQKIELATVGKFHREAVIAAFRDDFQPSEAGRDG